MLYDARTSACILAVQVGEGTTIIITGALLRGTVLRLTECCLTRQFVIGLLQPPFQAPFLPEPHSSDT